MSDVFIPTMCHHKASGQAVVWLEGGCVYLGLWRSAAAKAEYDKVIAEWLANGRKRTTSAPDMSIAEIMVDYLEHCQRYYRLPDGTPSEEVNNIKLALQPLRRLYGREPAATFGPLALKAVREEMVRGNWCRNTINRSIGRVKALFKWATANERIPNSIYHGLEAVAGLRAGRSDAREAEPVKPVREDHVQATLDFLPPMVAAMVQLQLLTGMRPGEVCAMRTCEVDTSGTIWTYRPEHHKTLHHGHQREVAIGPRAQRVLSPFLKPDMQAFCFSPAQSEQERHVLQRQSRKTPMTPSQRKRGERAAQCQRDRAPGSQYEVAAYRRAIARAADKADAYAKGGWVIGNDQRLIPRWHPHQLRHTAATLLRKEYGLEAARVVLGHRSAAVTQIYAEIDRTKAMDIMAKVG